MVFLQAHGNLRRDNQIPIPDRLGCQKLNNPIYGFKTTDCKDYEFGLLTADVAGVSYDAEHVLEAQLISQFFDTLKNLGPFPHPDPTKAAAGTTLKFCPLVKLLWNAQAVIPGLETALGTDIPLIAFKHVASQFPTDKWKKEEYVCLEKHINAPPKGNAWGGFSSKGKSIQVVDLEKWLGTDPNANSNSPSGQNPPKYPSKSKIANIDGAEEIMKPMRVILGSRLYHNTPAIQKILKDQKERVGEVLRRLDTEVLPNTPKNPGWTPWASQDLKGRWDRFMSGKMALAASKSKMVTTDVLPRMQVQWASQAHRDATNPHKDDDQATIDSKKEASEAG